jgi:hypothetical protein
VVWEGYVTNQCHRTRSRSGSRSLQDGVECSPGSRPLRATVEVGEFGGGQFQLDGASTTFTTKPIGLIFPT